MNLTAREREIVDLLRAEPLLDAAALAERIGSTRAAVSVHLSNLTRKGVVLGRGYLVRPEAGSVLVVGGAVLDTKVRTAGRPGARHEQPRHRVGDRRRGGPQHRREPRPARPADGAGRRGGRRPGRRHRACSAPAPPASSAGTSSSRRTRPAPTPPCSTTSGDLHIAVADMRATDELAVADLGVVPTLLGGADALVVDANLDATVIRWLLSAAQDAGVRSVFEPVSVAKATAAAPVLDGSVRVHTVTPNVDELAALVGHPVADTVDAVRAAADELHARGVEHVWVRRGTRGSLLSVAGPATPTPGSRAVLVGAPEVEVADVTGAGDSMTAGYVHALLDGADVVEAARYGQVLAALTCASADTVRADLTAALVAAHLTPTQPPTEELPR